MRLQQMCPPSTSSPIEENSTARGRKVDVFFVNLESHQVLQFLRIVRPSAWNKVRRDFEIVEWCSRLYTNVFPIRGCLQSQAISRCNLLYITDDYWPQRGICHFGKADWVCISHPCRLLGGAIPEINNVSWKVKNQLTWETEKFRLGEMNVDRQWPRFVGGRLEPFRTTAVKGRTRSREIRGKSMLAISCWLLVLQNSEKKHLVEKQ